MKDAFISGITLRKPIYPNRWLLLFLVLSGAIIPWLSYYNIRIAVLSEGSQRVIRVITYCQEYPRTEGLGIGEILEVLKQLGETSVHTYADQTGVYVLRF